MVDTQVEVNVDDKTAADPERSDIDALRQQLAARILANINAILDGAIEKAKQGHYSLTKLLFAVAGIYPATVAAETTNQHSLAEFLCKQLNLPLPAGHSAVRDGEPITDEVESHPT
jgi:hypothetical protein